MSSDTKPGPKSASELMAELQAKQVELNRQINEAKELAERESKAMRDDYASRMAVLMAAIKSVDKPGIVKASAELVKFVPGVYALNVDSDGTPTIIATAPSRYYGARVPTVTVAADGGAPRGEKGALYAKLAAEGKTFSEIANMFGVTPSTVADMVHRHNGTGRHSK